MRSINTRQADTADDIEQIFALRYDYYVVSRELEIAADHACRLLRDPRDSRSRQYGTFIGEDLVGCFRIEVGVPDDVAFGADWTFGDFLDEIPSEIALVSGLCMVPYLRDEEAVIQHMVRESVAFARELTLPHVFFETSPDLWLYFHSNGLTRKGGALIDRRTGLPTAVYQLDCRPQSRFPYRDPDWSPAERAGDFEFLPAPRKPRLKIVMGGRG